MTIKVINETRTKQNKNITFCYYLDQEKWRQVNCTA